MFAKGSGYLRQVTGRKRKRLFVREATTHFPPIGSSRQRKGLAWQLHHVAA